MNSILTKDQKIKSEWRYNDNGERMQVTIRYDDECGNGHNSFSITAHTKKNGLDSAFGCLHEEIEKYFPEYKHLIKWHLCSSNEPMHYLANTLYLASDKDHWGQKKGEIKSYDLALKFENFPITFKSSQKFIKWIDSINLEVLKDSEVLAIYHDNKSYTFGPKYTLGGFADKWHECPFDTEIEALEFLEAIKNIKFSIVKIPTAYSEGKERDLEAARRSAIWPDATDQDLLSDNLKEKLIERLPALMQAFKQDIEALGFIF